MCVLTWVPHKDGQITITHNRDESTLRPMALPPAERSIGNTRAIFPQDPQSGGTWFALHDNWVCALLNGGFEKHIRQPFYARSRGTVIPDLLAAPDIASFLQQFDPEPLEPFTLVAFQRKKRTLDSIVWHESKLYHQSLPYDRPMIWSSSTLYSAEVKAQRKILFEHFLESSPNAAQLFDLHQLNTNNDPAASFRVQLTETLCTVSTIQVTGFPDHLDMRYQSNQQP